jgi:hypothetical protein
VPSERVRSGVDAARRVRFRAAVAARGIANNSFDQVSRRRTVCIKSPFDIAAMRVSRFRGRYLSPRINGRTDIS